MGQGQPPSPVRSTFFFSVILFLFVTVGFGLQRLFKLPGLMAMQIFLFLGLSLAFAVFGHQRPLREVFRLRMLSLSGLVKSLLMGMVAWALAYVMGSLLLFFVTRMGGKMPEMTYRLYLEAPFPLALLAGAVLPAIGEEFLFRGYILWNLGPLGTRWAVLLTGILFGAMHLSLIRVLPLMALGVIFAAVVQRSGSILPGMIMHFVNNATALSLSFLFQRTPRPAPDGAAPSLPTAIFLLTAATVLGMAAWSLSHTFGPGDLAEEDPVPEPEPRAPGNPRSLLALVPLLPAALIYAWAAANELYVVFVQR